MYTCVAKVYRAVWWFLKVFGAMVFPLRLLMPKKSTSQQHIWGLFCLWWSERYNTWHNICTQTPPFCDKLHSCVALDRCITDLCINKWPAFGFTCTVTAASVPAACTSLLKVWAAAPALASCTQALCGSEKWVNILGMDECICAPASLLCKWTVLS